jgi:hypothetical protein
LSKAYKYKVVRRRPTWTVYRYVLGAPAVLACPQVAVAPDAGSAGPVSLLANELDETNNWARTAFQIYFGLFALHLIINALAMGQLVGGKGFDPAYANGVLSLLVGWNLLGLIGTLFVYKGLSDSGLRTRDIVNELNRRDAAAAGFESRSPVPQQALNAVFVVCAITLFFSLAFWAIQLVERQGR